MIKKTLFLFTPFIIGAILGIILGFYISYDIQLIQITNPRQAVHSIILENTEKLKTCLEDYDN